MTGYGRREAVTEGKKILVEIKSVNHRYSDYNIKVQRHLGFLEDKIRKYVSSSITRGKVDIYLNVENYETADKQITLNKEIAKNYIDVLYQLRDEFGLKDDITVSNVASNPDIFSTERVEEDEEALWVDCDKKDVASVEQNLNTLISNTSHIKMDTYHAQLQSAEFSARTMKLGCYLFMAVVGFIGFMNMANTMIMHITTKKQEYGVLQAVGMTNKQLNLCLQLQGLIFTVGTICVALIVGLPLGYAIFSYAKHNGIFGMNVYHVPITPILAMILLVSLLQIVLSLVLSSNLKKETLVERIRYQG